ncbi:Dabb family protein [Plantibacter sp. VKM Ac-2880]|uniref:Dabb family protein n=1 Tax=Plantibacter sp. VKM Ac-2880 TaxID=2783827 RepID=UPI0018906504|nr:Dabb family protein [Plantibacter sp. VKM Ac-2880]
MIKHIVLFRVTEGTPQDRIEDAIQRLEALVGVIPGLRSLDAGIDIGVAGNMSFGLVAELDDRESLDAFSTDPRHMEVALSILELRSEADIAVLDLEV